MDRLTGFNRVLKGNFPFLQLSLEKFELILYSGISEFEIGAWIIHFESCRHFLGYAGISDQPDQPFVGWSGKWAGHQCVDAFFHARAISEIARQTQDDTDTDRKRQLACVPFHSLNTLTQHYIGSKPAKCETAQLLPHVCASISSVFLSRVREP
jgi:hypothetical protein